MHTFVPVDLITIIKKNQSLLLLNWAPSVGFKFISSHSRAYPQICTFYHNSPRASLATSISLHLILSESPIVVCMAWLQIFSYLDVCNPVSAKPGRANLWSASFGLWRVSLTKTKNFWSEFLISESIGLESINGVCFPWNLSMEYASPGITWCQP